MSPVLAASAVLLVFGAVWELAGGAGERLGKEARGALRSISGGRASSLDGLAIRLRLPQRIARAGLGHSLGVRSVIAGKFLCAGLGLLVALVATPVVSTRLGLVIGATLVAAGFLGPDALLERLARRRRARFIAALPDALDMLAVGAASGRNPATVFSEIAGGTSGPLAIELATTVAEIECGSSIRGAIDDLRLRVPGAEVGALASALERSKAYGSPLAEQLHQQATALRRDARRLVEDRAARAAPKIQLVVALVLVPSVLLTLFAAILAHSDSLLARF